MVCRDLFPANSLSSESPRIIYDCVIPGYFFFSAGISEQGGIGSDYEENAPKAGVGQWAVPGLLHLLPVPG